MLCDFIQDREKGRKKVEIIPIAVGRVIRENKFCVNNKHKKNS